MAKIKMIVVAVGRTSDQKAYYAKFQSRTSNPVQIEGIGTQDNTAQLTYFYRFNQLSWPDLETAQAKMVGVEREIDTDLFDIEYSQFEIDKGGVKETIETKWLKGKRPVVASK